MPNLKTWVLTDTANAHWLDAFATSANDFPAKFPAAWSIRKRTLHGGKQEGVDLIEVDNGAFSFSILPTRGMGLWRGQYKNLSLGWRSPVRGPVHPEFVNLMDRGGLGWLEGFDEWLVRCGLHSNGPPGEDPLTKEFLPLHGRIANQPAHFVEVRVDLDPPHELRVVGQVDEGGMFLGSLRMTTTIATTAGSNRLILRDEIENRASQPADLELLYHCQFGPPLLGAGSRVRAPVRAVVPRNLRAAQDVTRWEVYAGPTAGFVEQVYFCELMSDSQGRTLALLHDAGTQNGVVLRFDKKQLPRFIVWKNTGAEEDGYVTGLEPATNFPNSKPFERDAGRVLTLRPGDRYVTHLSVEVHDSPAGVASVLKEIDRLQGGVTQTLHTKPQADLCEVAR